MDKMDDNDLKPCPFCRGQGKFVQNGDSINIVCTGCGAECGADKSAEILASLWNGSTQEKPSIQSLPVHPDRSELSPMCLDDLYQLCKAREREIRHLRETIACLKERLQSLTNFGCHRARIEIEAWQAWQYGGGAEAAMAIIDRDLPKELKKKEPVSEQG